MLKHAVSVVALFVTLFVAQRGIAKPPNVVLIISDDQAWNDYGFMGHDTIRTPHLDKLAAQSATFPRGYVPTSLCRPSLMSLVTGLHPHQHGVTGNDPPGNRADRDVLLKHIRAVDTLPEILGRAGYVSLQTGKWWEGHPREGGFTHFMSHGDPNRGGRHGDEGLKIGRQGMQPIFDFIDSAGDKPFFVWYAPFMPHSPHTPPERILQKYLSGDRSPHVARYYAMCEWFDETCGELLGYLDAKKLADDTLVVYVTDNGWIQNPNSPQYAAKSKRSPYDGGMRTPIMLRWPGHIAPAVHDDLLVSGLDLLPTIVAACEQKVPANLPGLNLLGVGGPQPLPRNALFGAVFEHDIPDIDDPAAGLLFRWGIEDHLKLIRPANAAAKPELYDLSADPHEENNLATDRPQDVERLQRLIDAWWSGT